MTTITQPQSLSPTERDQLTQAEEQIQSGLNTFITIGQQLVLIRENKLYRENYNTFEDYMLGRWNIKKSTGYDYINGYKFASQLQESTTVDINDLKPSFTRLLQKYDPQTQVNLYTRATVIAQNEETDITSKHINLAITEHETSFTRLLQKYDPQTQVNLYTRATVIAQNEETDITSKHINLAITEHETERTRHKVYETKCSPLINAMNENELKPERALKIWQTLQECQPSVRGDMLRHKIYDTELILLMNRKRHTNTYKEAIVIAQNEETDITSKHINLATPIVTGKQQIRHLFHHRRAGGPLR